MDQKDGEGTCPDDERRAESPWFRVKVMGGARGRGLVSAAPIPPHTVVHVAPCVPISSDEYERHLRHTVLEHYVFNARRGGGGGKLLALGYGSLFNHSGKPNVDYRVDADNSTITYKSGPCAIPAGVELCISYGHNLWFEDDNGDTGAAAIPAAAAVADDRGRRDEDSDDADQEDLLDRVRGLLEDPALDRAGCGAQESALARGQLLEQDSGDGDGGGDERERSTLASLRVGESGVERAKMQRRHLPASIFPTTGDNAVAARGSPGDVESLAASFRRGSGRRGTCCRTPSRSAQTNRQSGPAASRRKNHRTLGLLHEGREAWSSGF
jgi:hypothetical protein